VENLEKSNLLSYILKRLLLIIPTLLGIITLNFLIVQLTPGGPVEQMMAKLEGHDSSKLDNVSGKSSETQNSEKVSISKELEEEIKKEFGFDKPLHERYFTMLSNYLTFDLGKSFFYDKSVWDLILEKLPVSISLGLLSTLLIYLISVPLGILKAITDGSKLDIWTTTLLAIGNAIPTFLFAILLIILFASGNFFELFPLRGLTSSNFDELSTFEKIIDWLWHLTLPVVSLVIGSFATMTLLTKNSFLDEMKKPYVITARSKGLRERYILKNHIFRNGMLIIISGIPSAIIGILFTGSVLIEIIFSLDGLGLLGFESILNRDYPVIFGTLYIFTLISLLLNLITDLTYKLIDPRIDFDKR
jgi:microcin C transport system permease protein